MPLPAVGRTSAASTMSSQPPRPSGSEHPDAAGVVVKLDNSGDRRRQPRRSGSRDAPAAALLRDRPSSPWGRTSSPTSRPERVVEELVTGARVRQPQRAGRHRAGRPRGRSSRRTSSSTTAPTGRPMRGAASRRVPCYRSDLAAYGAVRRPTARGPGRHGPVLRRLRGDRARRRRAGSLHGLEINLRRSGTSHPLSLLHNLRRATTTPAPASGPSRTARDAATARPTTSSTRPGAGVRRATSSRPSIAQG